MKTIHPTRSYLEEYRNFKNKMTICKYNFFHILGERSLHKPKKQSESCNIKMMFFVGMLEEGGRKK